MGLHAARMSQLRKSSSAASQPRNLNEINYLRRWLIGMQCKLRAFRRLRR